MDPNLSNNNQVVPIAKSLRKSARRFAKWRARYHLKNFERTQLRPMQKQFATETEKHFSRNEQGFFQCIMGGGKTGCIQISILQGLANMGETARVLVLVPSVLNLASMLEKMEEKPDDSFWFQKMGLPSKAVKKLQRHICKFKSTSTEDFKKSWVVVSTHQRFCKHYRKMDPAMFSEIYIDEGDVGTASKEDAVWAQMVNYFTAKKLLLSATRDRSDGVLLPDPYMRWRYADSLKCDPPTAKKIQLTYVLPGALSFTKEGENYTVDNVEELKPNERRAILKSVDYMKLLLEFGLSKWMEQRKKIKIPISCSVVSPSVAFRGSNKEDIPFIERIHEIVQEFLKGKICPLTGEHFRTISVHTKNADKMDPSSLHEQDVIVSYGKLGRAADYPRIAFTINLRSFSSKGYSAFLQGPIGRGIRTLAPSEPRLRNFSRTIAKWDQTCFIIENGINNHFPLYNKFAKDEQVVLDVSTKELEMASSVWLLDDSDSDQAPPHCQSASEIAPELVAKLPDAMEQEPQPDIPDNQELEEQPKKRSSKGDEDYCNVSESDESDLDDAGESEDSDEDMAEPPQSESESEDLNDMEAEEDELEQEESPRKKPRITVDFEFTESIRNEMDSNEYKLELEQGLVEQMVKDSTKLFKCHECPASYNNENSLRQHELTSHQTPIKPQKKQELKKKATSKTTPKTATPKRGSLFKKSMIDARKEREEQMDVMLCDKLKKFFGRKFK